MVNMRQEQLTIMKFAGGFLKMSTLYALESQKLTELYSVKFFELKPGLKAGRIGLV